MRFLHKICLQHSRRSSDSALWLTMRVDGEQPNEGASTADTCCQSRDVVELN